MTWLRFAIRAVFFAGIVCSLAGCSTIDQRVATIRKDITSIELTSLVNPQQDESEVLDIDQGKQPPPLSQTISAETLLAYNTPSQCPNILIVDDLNSLYQFAEISNPKESDLISSVFIRNTSSDCKYKEDNMVVNMSVNFEGIRGLNRALRQPEDPDFSYPYFVALTDAEGNIIAKEEFALTVSYEAGQNSIIHSEKLDQIIPVSKDLLGSEHAILVGFQLTEQEFAYNKDIKQNEIKLLAQGTSMSEIEPAAGDNILQDIYTKRAYAKPQKLDFVPNTKTMTTDKSKAVDVFIYDKSFE